MKKGYVVTTPLPRFELWERISDKRFPLSFDLEITARCNNRCRHCYINVPAGDKLARQNELSIQGIGDIASQAVELGSLWCLITGGEPLLRSDFVKIYLLLKKMGLLVSVFTNGCLLNADHIALFKESPPRNIEVTVYGSNQQTYERVTRKPGSFMAFRRGLDLLSENNIAVRLKAMALRSNVDDLEAMSIFCRQYTKDFFRFDPLLHLRFDGNVRRNREILAERLSPQEIVAIEQADQERATALQDSCQHLIFPDPGHWKCGHLFHCGAGNGNFAISSAGLFRLCSSLWHPDCIYDLKNGSLAEAWSRFVPKVRAMTSKSPGYLKKCNDCPIVNLCLWCPAHAHLEHGRLDAWDAYFCQVAHARAGAIESKKDLGKHSGV